MFMFFHECVILFLCCHGVETFLSCVLSGTKARVGFHEIESLFSFFSNIIRDDAFLAVVSTATGSMENGLRNCNKTMVLPV